MRNVWIPTTAWLVSMIINGLSAVVLAQSLPERVATHFNAAGHANGWMTRTGHLAFSLAFGLGMPVFLAALMYVMRFIPGSMWNVPNKLYWSQPQHHQRAAAQMFRLGLWLAALTALWTTSINGLIWQANQSQPPLLHAGPMMISVSVYLAGVAVWVIALMRVFWKVPKE